MALTKGCCPRFGGEGERGSLEPRRGREGGLLEKEG